MAKSRNVVGKLINFRGLVYAPVEENGVIFLFSKLTNDLNLYIETIRKNFPDCIAKRYIGNGQWEEVFIEFEFKSSGFLSHKHIEKMEKGAQCDIIICWEHDWKECPSNIEIIELKTEYLNYAEEEDKVIDEPDKVPQVSEVNLEDLYKGYKNAQSLYEKLHESVRRIDPGIWRKVKKTGVYYSCPERLFFSVKIQKQGLRIRLFNSGKEIEGVEPISEAGNYAQKWGQLFIKKEPDIKIATTAIRKSFKLIKQAIKNNEKTGWYAEVEKK